MLVWRRGGKAVLRSLPWSSRTVRPSSGMSGDGNVGESSLSECAKERMYELHKENPEVNTVEKLAADYRVKKQRVHAILWLREMQKEEEARLGQPLEEELEEFYESLYGKESKDEKKTSNILAGPESWEGMVDENASKNKAKEEEKFLMQEFERRMEFNKKQIYGFVKTHIMSRRRPIDGWSYMVEELGLEAKRARASTRTITEPDGTKRVVSEEKFAKRERILASRRSL